MIGERFDSMRAQLRGNVFALLAGQAVHDTGLVLVLSLQPLVKIFEILYHREAPKLK